MHALVVEPRTEVIEEIEDRLESINHSFDIATSQRQAREQLSHRKSYSYIIMSLKLPVKPERPSRTVHGLNLFNEIREMPAGDSLPVVVTCDRSYDGGAAFRILNDGAFVALKPFEDNGELSLENAVREALDSTSCQASVSLDVSVKPISDKQDHSSEDPLENRPIEQHTIPRMTFYKNRVEFCGVTVCGDSSTLTRRLLDLLKERTADGKYRAYSGYELAIIADCESGQQGISACISKFRNKCLSLADPESIVDFGEIVLNDRTHGYRLDDSIEVINKISAKTGKSIIESPTGLADVQSEILHYLAANRKASRAELEDVFSLPRYVVNRHLQDLRDAGLIRCVGKGKATLWLPID